MSAAITPLLDPGEYFTALSTSFATIWLKRETSTRIMAAGSGIRNSNMWSGDLLSKSSIIVRQTSRASISSVVKSRRPDSICETFSMLLMVFTIRVA